jgi:SAM-dependent methyltransferase
MPRRQSPSFSSAIQEPQLSRAQKRSHGVYYTPPEIARLVVERTLAPLLAPLSPRGRGAGGEGLAPHDTPTRPLRILDPACGAGEFLVAAREFLNDQPHELIGIDIDSQAVQTTRERLAAKESPSVHVCVADALAESALPQNSFDAVIGNPPYVNIRELARQRGPDEVARLRERFRTARGNFDLYVLFIERALQWLKPGGCCGLIVPNKWATLDYARECRKLLLEQATLDEVIDLSAHRIFRQASVYPHVLIFRKQSAAANHAVRVQECGPLAPRADNRDPILSIETFINQSLLNSETFAFRQGFNIEAQVETLPLGQVASLQCGTTGYAAARIGDSLIEADAAAPPALSFITSGNIDRYAIIPGNVRFLGKTWRDPRLPLAAPPLTARQKKLFGTTKIVIAGMSRRIEAAWDASGLALGVQVYAATDWQVDPHYLLALLNSKLLSYLFRTRFAAKRLAGGYLAINKGQLARLPIAVRELNDTPALQLANLAKKLSSGRAAPTVAEEMQIDRLVYDRYQLTRQQIAEVERHFAEVDGNLRRAA